MAVSFIGGASGSTSATIPVHQVGDLIIARSFRDGNVNSPAVPAGVNWTSLDATNGANSNGASIAYKIATSTSETTGTWTNATRLDVGVWRGFASAGAHFSKDDGIAASVNYKGVLSFASGSWAIAFGAHRSINTSLNTAPTGMTNRYTNVNSTDHGVIHDTNGTVSSWSDTAVAVGGTASGWRTYVIEAVPSANAYTLTAAQGSYTLTGQTTGLLWKRLLSAAQGSYTLTGEATSFVHGYILAAAQGAYTLTGKASNLLFGRKVTAVQGSYTLTGETSGLLWKRLLTAVQGAYTLTGETTGLLWKRLLTAVRGSYVLTGEDATLTHTTGVILTASPGHYALTGSAVTLRYSPANVPVADSHDPGIRYRYYPDTIKKKTKKKKRIVERVAPVESKTAAIEPAISDEFLNQAAEKIFARMAKVDQEREQLAAARMAEEERIARAKRLDQLKEELQQSLDEQDFLAAMMADII